MANEHEAALQDLWTTYVERVLAHDTAGAMACWDAGAVTAMSTGVLAGADTIGTQYFQRTFDAIPDDRWEPYEEAFRVIAADAAYVTYRYRFSGTIRGTLIQREGLGTNLFKQTPAGWRVVHEHCHLLPG